MPIAGKNVVGSNRVPFPAIKVGVTQSRTTTASSAQSSALAATTDLVLLWATENAWVALGASPTAAASAGANIYVPKLTFLYLLVTPGHKIAAIRDSGDGVLHIYEAASSE